MRSNKSLRAANRPRGTSSRRLVAVGVMALLLAACSGGGGGGGGDAIVVSIEVTGAGSLWSGVNATPPGCPIVVDLNALITFVFGGPVDAASLPGLGAATGSINITREVAGMTVPATGAFLVEDDPALPPGNRRRVVFVPAGPTSTMPLQGGGLDAGQVYTVFVPAVGVGGASVTIGGVPMQTSAIACFTTCDPTAPGATCLAESFPGPPFMTATVPASSDPPLAPIDPATIAANTVTSFFSEPLVPESISLTTVRLVNVTSAAQVPGALAVFQAGSPEAGPTGTRIDYVATSELDAGQTFELVIDPTVVDLNGEGAVAYDPASGGPASGRRFFSTTATAFCPQTPFTEDFSTTMNRDSVTGFVRWDGSGSLAMDIPLELIGDGSFGSLVFAPGPATVDTGMPPVTGFAEGSWQAIDVDVQAGATVRIVGPFRAHFRAQGTINVEGTLDGGAGDNPTASPGTPEAGPGSGAFNNGGSPGLSVVQGGTGGVGAGAGGRASWAGFTVRTEQGEAGEGPPIAGLPNLGGNDFFGGGSGGDGGFRFPSGGVIGELGGLGGAGGSAFDVGENGEPHSTLLAGCTPLTPLVQSISLAAPMPPVFVAPITVASAGSGGGGGGDRHEVSGPTSDDQGGGGGGGGGGIRMSCRGELTLGGGALIDLDGANGGQGNTFFGGGGGGGSGGQLWLQSFGDITISSLATLGVVAGSGTNLCGDHAGGAGGDGLIQLEDQDGIINTSFLGTPAGNIVTETFAYSTQVTGVATSTFFDTGYGTPDFAVTPGGEVFDLGSEPGGTVTIRYQGAHEAVSGGGPDLATLTAEFDAASIDQLDGFRYVRFIATLGYDVPAMGLPMGTLPSVQSIQISYSTPTGCGGS